jgi:2-desacetyl-2-hydroxyethyl bacteriochlorophyllide A dehydrogenase
MMRSNKTSEGATMRAVRIEEDHSIGVREIPAPSVQPGEIIVRAAACGICGTDLHILQHGFKGTVYPVVPGHEFAGYVFAVGAGVKGLKEGDFVAVDPNVVCHQCRWCRAGRPNLCERLSPIGVGRAGAAAELTAVPAGNAFLVRESLGAGPAALIEPLACALHALHSAGDLASRSVLVMGSGTMGLLTAIACRHFGAGQVTIAEPSSAKHVIARRAGIERTVRPDELGEARFDVVFEAAGAMPALTQALRLVDKTGTLVQVGVHEENATVPIEPFHVYEHEIRIVGSNSLADKYPAAVEVMADIRQQVEPLITDTFPVWEFAKAVENMGRGTSVKTQLHYE